MKATLLLLAPVALLVSCTQNQDAPVAPAVNSGNPYGVPPAQPTGAYNPVNPPYQPVNPINPPATSVPPANAYGTPPPAPIPTTPSVPAPSPDLNGNVYTIQKKDTLWGLSRKFGASVEAIKEVNGLTSDTIIDGNTLIIPGR